MTIAYNVLKEISAVKKELTEIIAREIKKDFVKTSWNNYDLIIRIEKMGTSEIRLTLKDEGEKGVSIFESKRNISMMHKPFVGEVELMVEDIVGNKLGAKKA